MSAAAPRKEIGRGFELRAEPEPVVQTAREPEPRISYAPLWIMGLIIVLGLAAIATFFSWRAGFL